jgi:hypothetical protein
MIACCLSFLAIVRESLSSISSFLVLHSLELILGLLAVLFSFTIVKVIWDEKIHTARAL